MQVLDSAEKMRQRFAPDSTKAPVLAHMTPVGMIPRIERTLFTRVRISLDQEQLKGHHKSMLVFQDQIAGYSVVFDAVYTPPETQLLKEAKAAGVTPVSGVEMFVRQGADQFFNFTGKMRTLPPAYSSSLFCPKTHVISICFFPKFQLLRTSCARSFYLKSMHIKFVWDFV